MWVQLLLLFFLPLQVESADGCYLAEQVRCGDKCAYWCQCGKVDRFNIQNTDKWCCVQNSTSCHGDFNQVVCDEGVLQPLSVPCQGQCNDKRSDSSRGKRAHIMCDRGDQCVKEADMCQGTPLCQDNSDIDNCKSEKWKGVPCINEKETRCSGFLPGQCIPDTLWRDGTFDCWDRSDEKGETVKVPNPDLSTLLKDCCDGHGQPPGLTCNGICKTFDEWCREEYTSTCPELGYLTTTDPLVCSNATFWVNKSCEILGQEGRRCSSSKPGQCFYHHTSVSGLHRSCEDSSDQIHPLTDNNTNKPFYCPEKYPNRNCKYECNKNYVSDHTDPWNSFHGHNNSHLDLPCHKCLDPSNCTASCLTPGPSCQACTNPSYFPCRENVCIARILRCDGHPNCRQGEDEDGCYRQYRDRGLVPKEATFPCYSPVYHPGNSISRGTVTILAVRCDSIVECWDSKDELDCHRKLLDTSSLGKY